MGAALGEEGVGTGGVWVGFVASRGVQGMTGDISVSPPPAWNWLGLFFWKGGSGMGQVHSEARNGTRDGEVHFQD